MAEFSIVLMLQKAVQSGVKALVGIAIGLVGADTLTKFGIQVDVQALTVALSALAVAGLEALRNYLKQKLKVSWL